MIRGCLSQIIALSLIGIVILWFFRAPESVAGLITGALGLIAGGADAIGRFVTALTPTITGLF